jgi:hypothetical protein
MAWFRMDLSSSASLTAAAAAATGPEASFVVAALAAVVAAIGEGGEQADGDNGLVGIHEFFVR